LLRVWFESDKKDEMLYRYSIPAGQNDGNLSLERTSFYYALHDEDK